MGGAVGGDLGEGRGQWAVGSGASFSLGGFPGPSSEPPSPQPQNPYRYRQFNDVTHEILSLLCLQLEDSYFYMSTHIFT